MSELLGRLLRLAGINPRMFFALTRSLLLMDLRGQHYVKMTAANPGEVISPLLVVMALCVTISCVASLVLFLRVDVFFYALVGIGFSMLATAASILVEFNEVVVDPKDLDILGHRPIPPRTYAAARLANLFFYIGLIFAATTVFPLVVGSALDDAGGWYAPAYLLASLTGCVMTACLVVLGLTAVGSGPAMQSWRQVFSWTHIVLLLIVGYGAQLMLRDARHSVEVWAAFPPAWLDYLPPAWLGRFVQQAAVEPNRFTSLTAAGMAMLAVVTVLATIWRLTRLYRRMQPARLPDRVIVMPEYRVGSLGRPLWRRLIRGHEQRVGFWMCLVTLRRDGDVLMRSLLSLNMPVAVVLLGVATQQFGNPLVDHDLGQVTLPLLAVYLAALAVPQVVYNLSFSDDWEASWLLSCAPLVRPGGLGRGVCTAVQLVVATPLSLLLACAMFAVWHDLPSALLHAGLAWGLSWLAGLASLWLVVPGLPLTQPYARGSNLGTIALPLAGFSAVAMTLAAVHFWTAAFPLFWIGTALLCVVGALLIGRKADERLARLWSRGS